MDLAQLKKERSALRRHLTNKIRTLTDAIKDVKKDEMDDAVVAAHLQQLTDNNSRLKDLDEKIRMKLLEQVIDPNEIFDEDQETELDAEMDKTESYQIQVGIMMNKLEMKLKPIRTSGSPESSVVSVNMGRSSTAKQYKLPKIQLKKFSGKLSEWLGWWAQFSKIHNDKELHEVDKFSYLSQSMVPGTRAKQLVDSFPMTAENYPEVVQALQDRFGQEDLLIPHYIRELLQIVVKNATSEEKTPLSTLYDKIETDIRALGTLKVTTEEMGRFLHPIVESCLDKEVFMAWQRCSLYEKDGSEEDPPKSQLDYLLQFLKEESKREMKRDQVQQGFQFESTAPVATTTNQTGHLSKRKKEKMKENMDDIPTAAGLSAQSVRERQPCIFCGKDNHASRGCYKAKSLNLEVKERLIKESRACFRCLVRGHRSAECRAAATCKQCGGPHCTIMCRGFVSSGPVFSVGTGNGANVHVPENYEVNKESGSTTASNLGVQCQDDVLLKTVLVKVQNPVSGKETKIRLLFDDASQRSYITKRVANLVMSRPVATEESRIVLMTGAMTDYETVNHHEVLLSALSPLSKPVKVLVRERTKIGCPTPKVPFGPWIAELKKKNIVLSDCQNSSLCSDIDVLIGSDYYESFRSGNRIHVQDGMYAVQTIFGWTLSGPVPREKGNSTSVIQSYFCGELNKLWDLEAVGIKDSAIKEDDLERDARVKQEFQENLKRDETGRYIVKLPWIAEEVNIPSNYEVAMKRLKNMTGKFRTQEEYDCYDQIFKAWQEEKIIEVVPEQEEKIGHFLPHRPVIKLESQTTPVRPVFDASCRVGKNPSLNMCLETGPNLLELIPSLLLKFRRKRIGVISDIRKAFQTIDVDRNDRNCQKFLWWKEKEKVIMEYRHCRVVFGMTCSPFILAAVLDYHLGKEGGMTAELLMKSLYVDNCVSSFDSIDEYRKFREESINLLLKAQMVLRQWESNMDEKMENEVTSVLGLAWNKKMDTLAIKMPKGLFSMDLDEITSRKVLSIVAQVYDPIGFTCPALLPPKMLLQVGWQKKKKWDEPWEEVEKKLFLTWLSELDTLCRIQVPRFAFRPHNDEESKMELHVFCDASQKAYAVVVFVRIEDKTGVSVQLLMAKSRVAPLEKLNKKVTIPRLELLACVIGARLALTIKEALDWKDPLYFGSDSTTCVAWIHRDEDWGTFVGNRVREIVKLTRKEDWRHVPGCVNPADLPSRGCTPKEIFEASWWEGPVWLRLPHEEWPTTTCIVNEDEILAERKKTVSSCVVLEGSCPRFSRYQTNVRVAAWMRRFINNSKRKHCSNRTLLNMKNIEELSPLSPEEILLGERDLIYGIQQRHFGEKPDVKGFMVEKHEDGLWRLKTRLLYKDDTPSFKFPVLLPKDDLLVEQLVRHVHEDCCHIGTQHVLNKLREKYWVIHGRSYVKKIIHKCMKCKRYRASKMDCDPAPLPAKRIDETVAAFQTTGVDLAGPLYMKGGKKSWIVLYTCATYRCVHLDLVDSLSTEAFLLSLERFINTVGRPQTVYSDNGTNFLGAVNLMKKLDWESIMKKSGAKRIQWIFIPPSAPWWGGWWERLVRSVKEILRKILGRAKTTYDEMRTCLAAVQQVINDRPLTTVTADSEDLRALTPAMFMRDLPVLFPEGIEFGEKFYASGYKKIQDLKTSLQSRFRKEYLGYLTSRNLKEENMEPDVGDLVLVGDSNRKRFEWPLGRIMENIPGKDGKVRVVKVKTAHGILTRPLQRLYRLETFEKASVIQDEDHNKMKVTTRSGRVVNPTSRFSN